MEVVRSKSESATWVCYLVRLKASKCTFAVQSVVFLGHELSAEGIRQEKSKMQAMRELPAPTDAGAVRRCCDYDS